MFANSIKKKFHKFSNLIPSLFSVFTKEETVKRKRGRKLANHCSHTRGQKYRGNGQFKLEKCLDPPLCSFVWLVFQTSRINFCSDSEAKPNLFRSLFSHYIFTFLLSLIMNRLVNLCEYTLLIYSAYCHYLFILTYFLLVLKLM